MSGFCLVFRRYAPFAQFGMGFEGDHRSGASVSMQATARTVGMVPFERNSVGSLSASSSGTEFVGAGDWLRRLFKRHMSDVTCKQSNVHKSDVLVRFTASKAGANPMIPGAPAIDTYVDFSAEWIGSSIRFRGAVRGDNFPNAEVFVLDSAGNGCLLFDGRTTGGQNSGPITRLAGANAEKKLGSFQCAIGVSPTNVFPAGKPMCPVTTMSA